MKYTIFGFSQKRLLKLGLGVDDALVLDWFVTFQGSGRMRVMVVDGYPWYWVNYSGVLKDIPIAGGSEKTISRRFARLEASGVLDHITIREGGTFSCYRLNEKVYTTLVSEALDTTEKAWSNQYDPKTELSEGMGNTSTDTLDKTVQGQTNLSDGGTEMGDGVGQKCPTPSDKSVRPKDSLTRITNLPEELEEPPISPAGGIAHEIAKASKPRFVKPTIEEIRAYCLERDNGIDAQEFFDSNETKGWVVGTTRTPMKDWQAAIRTWEHARKRNLQQAGNRKSGSSKERYHSEGNQPAPITGWKKLGGTV